MWLGREWETLPPFPIPQHPLSRTRTHTRTHTSLPPAHHHHHWHPAHDAAHLVCQPSHFRCRGNISQDGSFWARLYSNDLAGSLSSSWHRRSIPRWQYRWHQGLLVKKGWRSGGMARKRMKRRWRFRIDRFFKLRRLKRSSIVHHF